MLFGQWKVGEKSGNRFFWVGTLIEKIGFLRNWWSKVTPRWGSLPSGWLKMRFDNDTWPNGLDHHGCVRWNTVAVPRFQKDLKILENRWISFTEIRNLKNSLQLDFGYRIYCTDLTIKNLHFCLTPVTSFYEKYFCTLGYPWESSGALKIILWILVL